MRKDYYKKQQSNREYSQAPKLTFMEEVELALAQRYNPYRNGLPGGAHKYKPPHKRKKKNRR